MTLSRLMLMCVLGLCLSCSKQSPTQVEGEKTQEGGVAVVLETSLGEIQLLLDDKAAPVSVANFLFYVDQGFYRQTLFHRVIPGFMAQGGGFEPGMKKKETAPPIMNESANGLHNVRGTIAMARTNQPDSATSQFFINVADNLRLDAQGERPGYAVFGKVTGGMDVVDRIVSVPTTSAGPYANVPGEDVLILDARRVDLP